MPSHNIIYVDMDGVIVDFYEQYYRLAQVHDPELFTVLPKHDELDVYWLEDMVPERLEQRAIDLCNHPLLFEQAKPITGAIEGVLELERKARSYGFDTYICSAPSASNKKSYADKASWVERYLGSSWVQRLVLTQDKTLCDGLILIDDKPDPLGTRVSSWKHVIFDQPYNRQQVDKHVMLDWSSKSIDDVLDYTISLLV
jgi:5'-nucleotidase